MPNDNRFPSGATIDQVKKDAKKLVKAQNIPLNQALDAAALKHGLALPWNRVNDWLGGQKGSAIASFTLPLDNGGKKIVNLTYEQPLIMVCGWVGCGKSTTALVLVCCLTNKAPHTCETIASRARCTLFKMSSPLAFQT
ncbi:Conserved hypothetical protein (plasmid) [Pseudomonas veronii 1YdBTEX2]|uniref:Uncharacterized protein n=1 Tax=Pseudomonas veronii 1YdBTEX2 TaxID=1295141 RepID=A0A1D3KAS0_PSEVE|nr:Conserved hypothetical protein [Pseudomonas veronii 1YdBTEX2]